MTEAIVTTSERALAALERLGNIHDIESQIARTAPPARQISGTQFVKMGQANTTYPGIVTFGPTDVPMGDSSLLLDFDYRVGRVWNEGRKILKKVDFSWMDDDVEEKLAALGPGGKESYRTRAVGLTGAAEGVRLELGGFSAGWVQFFDLYIEQLKLQSKTDVSKPYAIVGIDVEDYFSKKLGDTVYNPLPIIRGWVGVDEAEELFATRDTDGSSGAATEIDEAVPDDYFAQSAEVETPPATARPRRRSMTV